MIERYGRLMESRVFDELEMLHERICLALGDPKRLFILYVLSAHPMTVHELTAELAIPQPTVSHHLKVLRERKLVHAERDGTSVRYSLTDLRVLQALDLLRAVLRDSLTAQARLADSSTLVAGTVDGTPGSTDEDHDPR